jgi:hypothetical protein
VIDRHGDGTIDDFLKALHCRRCGDRAGGRAALVIHDRDGLGHTVQLVRSKASRPAEFPFRIVAADEAWQPVHVLAGMPAENDARMAFQVFTGMYTDWRLMLLKDGEVIERANDEPIEPVKLPAASAVDWVSRPGRRSGHPRRAKKS